MRGLLSVMFYTRYEYPLSHRCGSSNRNADFDGNASAGEWMEEEDDAL